MIDQPLGYATAGTSKANERPPEGKIAPELKRLQVQIPSPDQSFQTRSGRRGVYLGRGLAAAWGATTTFGAAIRSSWLKKLAFLEGGHNRPLHIGHKRNADPTQRQRSRLPPILKHPYGLEEQPR